MSNYMLDKDFLYELDRYPHREIYAKITSLTFEEQPLESIEGRITTGSINIDGNSALRRTCNLTMVAEDVNITNFYWGVSNKFTLEIGLKNFINLDYPDIIWFKQGIFIITSFNTALAQNSYTISMTGQDKMCLLNGTLGGNLPSSIDFGVEEIESMNYYEVEIEDPNTQYKANTYYIKYEEVDEEGNTKEKYKISNEAYNKDLKYYESELTIDKNYLEIKDIIRELIHAYGKEMYHNIIINNLDDYGLELLEYRAEDEMYLLYDIEAGSYFNIEADKEAEVKALSGNSVKISEIEKYGYKYNSAIDMFQDGTYFVSDAGREFTVTKIGYGDAAGYRITNLTYPGDLISSIGETITSVLDKIKNMLGSFEYFYDLDGRFIFQMKKINSNISWNTLQEADSDSKNQPWAFARDAIEESPYSFSFEDVSLIQRFQNTPVINNIKNDYSIWGVRKTVNGAEIPIHARYAIQKKPSYYKNFDGQAFYSSQFTLDNDVPNDSNEADWRELIYQMALDYYKHNQEPDFYVNLAKNNIDPADKNISFYPTGETGYEPFYVDMQGFWRELYNPNPEIQYASEEGGYYQKIRVYEDGTIEPEDEVSPENIGRLYTQDWQWVPYQQTDPFCDYYLKKNSPEGLDEEYYSDKFYYWNRNAVEAPYLLNFWIDFYDGDEMLPYSISNIGNRSKVINNNKIASLYYKNTPLVVFSFGNGPTDDEIKSGYTYIHLDERFQDLFTISSQGKTAYDEINELINTHAYCAESANISAIPIYHLEPNTLIYVYNPETGINGKYAITKISIPLTHSGMMTLTGTKVLNPI